MKLFIGICSILSISIMLGVFFHDVVNYRKAKGLKRSGEIEELQFIEKNKMRTQGYVKELEELQNSEGGVDDVNAKKRAEIEGRIEVIRTRLYMDLRALRELNNAKINKVLESNFLLKRLNN